MEGCSYAEPWTGKIEKPYFQIASQCVTAEVLLVVPLVKLRVGTCDSAFCEVLCALPFDVSQVHAYADEELVEVVGTAGKGPFFRTTLEVVLLALPDVALGDRTAVIRTDFILVKVDEIGAPCWIDVVWEGILKLKLGKTIDLGQIRVNL